MIIKTAEKKKKKNKENYLAIPAQEARLHQKKQSPHQLVVAVVSPEVNKDTWHAGKIEHQQQTIANTRACNRAPFPQTKQYQITTRAHIGVASERDSMTAQHQSFGGRNTLRGPRQQPATPPPNHQVDSHHPSEETATKTSPLSSLSMLGPNSMPSENHYLSSMLCTDTNDVSGKQAACCGNTCRRHTAINCDRCSCCLSYNDKQQFSRVLSSTRHQQQYQSKHNCKSLKDETITADGPSPSQGAFSIKFNEHKNRINLLPVSIALALGFVCLALVAPVGFGAPIAINKPISQYQDKLLGSAAYSAQPVVLINDDLTIEQATETSNNLIGSIYDNRHHQPEARSLVDSGAKQDMAQMLYAIKVGDFNVNNPEIATDDDADEKILLVLASSSSAQPNTTSLRRLIKRSGISDQRLAEIQMIRALKKQLERATKLAVNSNGNGDGTAQSSGVDGGEQKPTS